MAQPKLVKGANLWKALASGICSEVVVPDTCAARHCTDCVLHTDYYNEAAFIAWLKEELNEA